jgi:hypothetical protein
MKRKWNMLRNWWIRSGGFLGVPFVVIIKDDESKETIVGFDKNKINQVLGLD